MEENRQRPPRKEENPVREWISDNLRYLILAAVLIAIALVVLFIVRAQYKKNHPDTPETVVSSVTESSSSQESSSQQEPGSRSYGGLVDGTETVTAVVEAYFDALNNADADSAAALLETVTEEDRIDILSGIYNRNYGSIRVYVYDREEENHAAVLVSYTYMLSGFAEHIPGLTEFCMWQKEDGSWLIASEETQRQYQQLMDEALSCEEGKSLVESVRNAFERVCAENPDLAAKIRG